MMSLNNPAMLLYIKEYAGTDCVLPPPPPPAFQLSIEIYVIIPLQRKWGGKGTSRAGGGGIANQTLKPGPYKGGGIN